MRRYSQPQSMIACSECNIGMMHKAQVTYFTWLGEEMITVPDFPAWICDVCGKREYDLEALNRLALMLSPLPQPSAKRNKSARPAQAPARRPAPPAE